MRRRWNECENWASILLRVNSEVGVRRGAASPLQPRLVAEVSTKENENPLRSSSKFLQHPLQRHVNPRRDTMWPEESGPLLGDTSSKRGCRLQIQVPLKTTTWHVLRRCKRVSYISCAFCDHPFALFQHIPLWPYPSFGTEWRAVSVERPLVGALIVGQTGALNAPASHHGPAAFGPVSGSTLEFE